MPLPSVSSALFVSSLQLRPLTIRPIFLILPLLLVNHAFFRLSIPSLYSLSATGGLVSLTMLSIEFILPLNLVRVVPLTPRRVHIESTIYVRPSFTTQSWLGPHIISFLFFSLLPSFCVPPSSLCFLPLLFSSPLEDGFAVLHYVVTPALAAPPPPPPAPATLGDHCEGCPPFPVAAGFRW